MKRSVIIIAGLLINSLLFAITESDAISFVLQYYKLVNEYVAVENDSPTIARKIEQMFSGNSIYPDVEVKLHGLPDAKGVAVTTYLTSLSDEQHKRMLLRFVPNRVSVTNRGYNDMVVWYMLYVYSDNEVPGQSILKYTVPLEMTIKDYKILGIAKAEAERRDIPVVKDPEPVARTKQFSVSTANLSFDAAGGTKYVGVTSTDYYYISTNTYNWSQLEKTSSGITVKCQPNKLTDSRTDYFVLKSGNEEIKVNIRQEGYKSTTTGGYVYRTIKQSDGSSYILYGNTVAYTDNAVGLKYLSDNLNNDYKACKTGAITERYGVAIIGNNGYIKTSGVPSVIYEKLKEANANGHIIHDVCLSNNGTYYAIAFGQGGWQANAPMAFLDQIRSYLKDGDVIMSMAINDKGEFAIITDKHFYGSTTTIHGIIKEAHEKYGYVYSVSLSNKGIVVCCNGGCYFKDIPTKVFEKIEYAAKQWKIKYVKFTDSGTVLITDGVSKYTFYL